MTDGHAVSRESYEALKTLFWRTLFGSAPIAESMDHVPEWFGIPIDVEEAIRERDW